MRVNRHVSYGSLSAPTVGAGFSQVSASDADEHLILLARRQQQQPAVYQVALPHGRGLVRHLHVVLVDASVLDHPAECTVAVSCGGWAEAAALLQLWCMRVGEPRCEWLLVRELLHLLWFRPQIAARLSTAQHITEPQPFHRCPNPVVVANCCPNPVPASCPPTATATATCMPASCRDACVHA